MYSAGLEYPSSAFTSRIVYLYCHVHCKRAQHHGRIEQDICIVQFVLVTLLWLHHQCTCALCRNSVYAKLRLTDAQVYNHEI